MMIIVIIVISVILQLTFIMISKLTARQGTSYWGCKPKTANYLISLKIWFGLKAHSNHRCHETYPINHINLLKIHDLYIPKK